MTNKIKKLESLCRALQQQGRGVPRPQADTGMLYILVVKDAKSEALFAQAEFVESTHLAIMVKMENAVGRIFFCSATQ